MFCSTNTTTSEEIITIYPANYFKSVENDTPKSSNRIRTTKYRFYNFIFLNFFEQFKRHSNLFFIFCVILNFIPQISAFGQSATVVIPIAFILITTLIKDGVEDLRRYLSDKNVNYQSVLKYDKTEKKFVSSLWKDIKVGDFIQTSSDQRIPADLLIYYSSDPSGLLFVETANIDGETTLKQKTIMKPIGSVTTEKDFQYLHLEIEAPNKEIYKFNGKLLDDRNGNCVRMLKYTNIVLRDTVLKNTKEIRGIVVYAGNQTKVFMNNNKARFKRSLLEDQLNNDMLMCLGILMIVCIMTGIGYTAWLNGFVNNGSIVFFVPNSLQTNNTYLLGFYQFWTSIIVFQSIIPIALYITLEMVKAHQIHHISSDLALYDETLNKRIDVKAYNITEDMGQIKHMFCDKTGTLTENVMIFKKASVDGEIYSTNDEDLILQSTNFTLNRSISTNTKMNEFLLVISVCNTTIINKSASKGKKVVDLQFDKADSIQTAASSCKTDSFSVFELTDRFFISPIPPVYLEDPNPIPSDLTRANHEKAESIQSCSSYGKASLSRTPLHPLSKGELFPFIISESPDEDALVKMAMCNGYRLHQRSNDKLFIWNENSNKWLNFDVLRTLPFDSVRKCMSVIVRDIESGQISLHCKGADSAMLKKIATDTIKDKEILEKLKLDIYSFASDGLRTLVFGKRILKEEEFNKWEEIIKRTEECLTNDGSAFQTSFGMIEHSLDLVGAVGIEDKLQEFVPEILECFKEAGINIWILTGDKRETAISIAFSTKLFAKDVILMQIICEKEEEIQEELGYIRLIIEKNIYLSKVKSHGQGCKHEKFGLVIDGCSLSIVLSSQSLKDQFLHVAYFCSSVVCCRCTPNQKAEVVNLIKINYGSRTLAVGDGANDVNMIQTADIGIGISGKEGSQASMSSDFAITKFKYLKRLILVHGHWSYDKLARMSLYMFYKNMFISIVLYFYQIVCGFSNSQAIDQITQLTFQLIQTGVPPLILGIWDKDFSDTILMANPQIYKTGINSKMYRPRDFWRYILDAIWQGSCVFFIPYLCYKETQIGMGEFGIVNVSCVIVIMFGHFLVESKHWSPFHWAICIGCLGIGLYFELFIYNSLCVVVIDCYTDNPYKVMQYTMARGKTYMMIIITTGTALLPRLFMKGFLLDSRDSIYYETHRRIKLKSIPMWSTNIKYTRKDSETEYNYDYKHSKYYLGDLEKFKSLGCDVCKYHSDYFESNLKTPFFGRRQSKVAPLCV